ncbi:MAG: T9SS type A sorting domain-containing protein [candidate division Zixibacteria bacterium]|nr:T9SS type A sorting domain-containing protein [candidate division Zixibacteria bacterium]
MSISRLGFIAFIFLSLINPAFSQYSYTINADIVALAVPPDSGAFFEAFLTNNGNSTDTYRVAKTTNMPDGWFSVICIDSLCLLDSGQVALEPGDSASIRPDLFPQNVPGDGEATVTITPQNNPDDVKTILFRAVSGYPVIVINQGDIENQYWSYYNDALTGLGVGFNYWDRGFSTYRSGDLLNFETIILYSGDQLDSVFTDSEILSLMEFISGGGNSIITGQGIASYLEGDSVLEDFLGVEYIDSYSGTMAVTGTADDPIGDGLSFAIEGGNGADNQVAPAIIAPVYNSPPVLEYLSGGIAAVRHVHNNSKSVFMAFGFEAISSDLNRRELLSRSFDWLSQSTSVDDGQFLIPDKIAIITNYPNPFNATTTIKLTSEFNSISEGEIEIYNQLGRLVRNLVLKTGHDSVVWDGRDYTGHRVSSGRYYYKLKSQTFNSDYHSMTLLK